MKTELLTFTAFAFLAHGAAVASCGSGSKIIFSCLATSGKKIEVCDIRQTIDYSFGKPNTPAEIVVKALRQDASTYQWNGFGRSRTYSVSVPNGSTIYTTFFSWDSLAPEAAPEAGVDVHVGENLVVTVKCSKTSNIIHELDDLDLKPTER